MSFCVAGAALCDIPTCLITCRKSFCVAGAILLRRFHQMSCSFRGRRSILDISVVILNGRRSTPDSTLHTQHSTLYTSHSALYIPHFTLYTPHFTPHTLHCTLHFALYTLHSTLYTPHSTTLHFTLYTSHPTLYTPHSTLYTPNSRRDTWEHQNGHFVRDFLQFHTLQLQNRRFPTSFLRNF